MNKKFKTDWSKTLVKIQDMDSKKNGSSFKDERIYYPQFNEHGVAQAIIRFLPSPDTDIPFVSVRSHSFKGVGGWLIENCPTTIKKECPVCKGNSGLWDSDPDLVRIRKRKLNYYSNVLVVKDPANPENEGKVYLYKYGKKVHDKILEKIQPGEGSIDQPIVVFDYYEGADFKLIIKKIKVGKDLMPNYDSCNFDSISCVGTDDEIESINSKLYPLSDFISEDKFKPYSELETKYNSVVGLSTESNHRESNQVRTQQPQTHAKPVTKVADTAVFDGDDSDFFKELQN